MLKDNVSLKMPICETCKKEIDGVVLNAIGKAYHPEHFVCTICKKPIKDKFQINENKPFCSTCFEEKFLEKCAVCNKPIADKMVKAMGKAYHSEHFLCAECKKPIDNQPYQERGGKAICQKCYLGKYAEKCKGCGKPIDGKIIVALDTNWHPECFRCAKCKKPITDDSFNVVNNQPVCSKCS